MGCAYQETCCHGMGALLSPWTGCDKKERDVVKGNNKWKGRVAGLGGLSEPVGVLPFIFCCSVYALCHFGMSVSFQTCLCVCEKCQKVGRRRASFLKEFVAENFQCVHVVLSMRVGVSLNCFHAFS